MEAGSRALADQEHIYSIEKMTTIFKKLNADWNADPNNPRPAAIWQGEDLLLRFYLNPYQFSGYEKGDMGEILFKDCARYRFGSLNDEGWYRGQGRFSDAEHLWGEFYQVEGDLRLDVLPADWNVRVPDTADRQHYLFYFRDEDFEWDAREWQLEVIRKADITVCPMLCQVIFRYLQNELTPKIEHALLGSRDSKI